MKELFLTLALIVAFLASAIPALAYVRVNGYYRSNGTYVNSYVRSNPNALRYDNYGYTGGSLYNKSYYTTTYTPSYYTPSYYTDSSYYYGRSLYNSYHYTPSYTYNY